MERPRIVVIEKRNYSHKEEYEEEIESWIGAGYKVVLRTGRTNEERDYTILEEQKE